MKKILSVLSILSLMALTSCNKDGHELGSRKNPIKMYFTPSVDAETITSNSKEFIKYLEKETGLYFESGIPTSYIAVVEALGSSRADVAVMNSFGYLLANEKYGAQAKLTTIRYGKDSYRGQIITHVDHNFSSVGQLQGKDFAYTDPSSTSGHLFPKKILMENQATPRNTVFASKHDNVVKMVYQKQVHAGATYYSPPDENGNIRDARMRLKTIYPDVEQKVKILELTDPIKNDPFVFRKDLPKWISQKIIQAITNFLKTPTGQKIFNDIYSVENVILAKDEDYNGLRNLIDLLKVDAKSMLK